MNKETQQILEHINKSGYALEKIDQLRSKWNNIKDFQNQFGYLVMEILSEEKKFLNLSRNKIDLPILAHRFFDNQ